MDKYQEFLKSAHDMADIADDIVRRYFRKQPDIALKSDHSPVTIADQEIESALKQYVTTHYPEHGFFGEETAQSIAEFTWVVDPIDGTKSFIGGIPTFATLIALCYNNLPVLGVVSQPHANDRAYARTDGGSYLNGERIMARKGISMAAAISATTSPFLFETLMQGKVQELFARSKSTIYGSDCYGYLGVASGNIDLVIESGLQAYDIMALVPIIKQAGGIIKNWDGSEVTLHSGHYNIIASGDLRLLAEAMNILQ